MSLPAADPRPLQAPVERPGAADGASGAPARGAGEAIRLALALSAGAAISLGITRFAYGLLLPPMRADLGWSYTLAGGMNTANAVGYLLGALCTPWLMRRFGSTRLLLAGAILASVFMAGSGFVDAAAALLAQRWLAGIASAWVFVAGGLLAARLGASQPRRSGFLLGLYYGGTGFGIVLSAVLVPAVLRAAGAVPHGWAWAWWALALASGLATLPLAWAAGRLQGEPSAVPASGTEAAGKGAGSHSGSGASSVGAGQGGGTAVIGARGLHGVPPLSAPTAAPRFSPARFGWALAGYGLFGAGYIGYMTFVIALLRDQGASAGFLTMFYALLGMAVIASSRLWAGLLDRWRDGRPQALLNALLGVATLLPVLSRSPWLALVSGLLFGAVFLSVVASTTALVRHNLPAAQWASGISAFTIVFALGQIVGPTLTGYISDGPGGLGRGLVASAMALWCAAALASRQRALDLPGKAPLRSP